MGSRFVEVFFDIFRNSAELGQICQRKFGEMGPRRVEILFEMFRSSPERIEFAKGNSPKWDRVFLKCFLNLKLGVRQREFVEVGSRFVEVFFEVFTSLADFSQSRQEAPPKWDGIFLKIFPKLIISKFPEFFGCAQVCSGAQPRGKNREMFQMGSRCRP